MSNSTSTTAPKLATYSDARQIRSFLRGQVFGTNPPITSSLLIPDLPSRTIIITGANSGLGLEAAKQLYALGVGRLILACRSAQKGEEARNTILSSTKSTTSSKQIIELYELDMSSFDSIVAFSQHVQQLDRVDTVLLNAGVDLVSYRKNTPEGYEMTIMVNVIGTFVLAALLVPVLRQLSARRNDSETPRISIVGSAVHFFSKYETLVHAAASGEGVLRYLSDEKRWDGKIGEDRYLLSKGCVQLLVQHLAGLISAGDKQEGKKQPSVIVHAVHPGYCRTPLFKEAANIGSRMALRLIGRDPDVGARALVVGAVGKEGGEKSHGGYMSEGKVSDSSSWLSTEQGRDIAKMMWEEITEIVQRLQPGTKSAL